MIVEKHNKKKEVIFSDLCIGDSFIYNNSICIKTDFGDSKCHNAIMYNEEVQEWRKDKFASLDKVIPIETKLVCYSDN